MRSQILGWLGDSFWQLLWWWCECCYRGPTHKSQIWGWLSVAFWRWIPFSMKLNDEPWWKFSYQSSWDVWLVSLIPCFGGLCEERLPCYVTTRYCDKAFLTLHCIIQWCFVTLTALTLLLLYGTNSWLACLTFQWNFVTVPKNLKDQRVKLATFIPCAL